MSLRRQQGEQCVGERRTEVQVGLTLSNRHLRDVLIARGYDVTYRETGGQHNEEHDQPTGAGAPPRRWHARD
jgi:hypothetical protein